MLHYNNLLPLAPCLLFGSPGECKGLDHVLQNKNLEIYPGMQAAPTNQAMERDDKPGQPEQPEATDAEKPEVTDAAQEA